MDELPKTLDETYERALQDIHDQNWEYAHRLFQCVSAASRPLRVEELAEFLAFDFSTEPIPTFVADWRSEDPVHVVLSTCPSLLSVVGGTGSSVIQFAHFSVKEYLTSERLTEANNMISRFHVSMALGHTIVAQACLGVLLHLDGNITRDHVKEFPLAEYAAKHWVDHALFEGVSPNIQDGMKRLFDPTGHHLFVWVGIYDPESRRHRYRDTRAELPSRARATNLHYATFCGLRDIVKFLIVTHRQDVNAPGFDRDETSLIVASRVGLPEVVRVLLEHGADIESRDTFGWSPLEMASTVGHVEVIRVLLAYGIDVNSRDSKGHTALHAASRTGQTTAARVLLEHSADVNAGRWDNQTPLHFAWNEGVTRVLIEYHGNTNSRDMANRTPLHRALQLGRAEAVALILLENGSDANSRDSTKSTPLHLASRKGYLNLVRVLIQRGADIHARSRGKTPIQLASAQGHHDVAQLLLEHGAGDGRT